MNDIAATSEIRLVCHPGKTGDRLVFPYELHNAGARDVLVMDALPSIAADSGTAQANDQAAVVILRGETEAVLGKYLPPLPTDRRMLIPLTPLARRLHPGEAHQAELRVPVPLAEASPYFQELRLRQYEVVELQSVVFAVCFWPADQPGLLSAPTEYAPELLRVVVREPAAGARIAWQRFPTKGLQLFKRSDVFPRSV